MMLSLLRTIEHAEATDLQVVGHFLAGMSDVRKADGKHAIAVDSRDANTFSVLQYLESSCHFRCDSPGGIIGFGLFNIS